MWTAPVGKRFFHGRAIWRLWSYVRPFGADLCPLAYDEVRRRGPISRLRAQMAHDPLAGCPRLGSTVVGRHVVFVLAKLLCVGRPLLRSPPFAKPLKRAQT